MKQITILIGVLALATTGLFAQKRSAKPQVVPQNSLYSASLGPASFLFSTLDLGLERRMTGRSSLLAQGHIGFRKIHLWESLGGNYFNYGGKLEFRNYVGK